MSILDTIPFFDNPTPDVIFNFSKDKKLSKIFFQLQRFPAAISTCTYPPSINFFEQEAIDLWIDYREHALKYHTNLFRFLLDLGLVQNNLLQPSPNINLKLAAQRIVEAISTVVTFTNAIIYLSHESKVCLYTTRRLVEECNNFPPLGKAIQRYYEIAQHIIKNNLADILNHSILTGEKAHSWIKKNLSTLPPSEISITIPVRTELQSDLSLPSLKSDSIETSSFSEASSLPISNLSISSLDQESQDLISDKKIKYQRPS